MSSLPSEIDIEHNELFPNPSRMQMKFEIFQ